MKWEKRIVKMGYMAKIEPVRLISPLDNAKKTNASERIPLRSAYGMIVPICETVIPVKIA